ncbi:MAG: hypothetical protein A2X25_15335 [Chloroflexi bacterium GWB2_49_20]|nr:MAG: hypothetical protein A2X25_15335 [Chloroflexi bacterium GWB2_49_20]OGN77441.1 MAG: hypothetical protein A2X26_13565 [Chloroflexi bacterium GWC2_49_37]OGN84855.1 MAG: hypothetical protein A2X27_14885 [Chloroflexi bacterium GWD2_49_16]
MCSSQRQKIELFYIEQQRSATVELIAIMDVSRYLRRETIEITQYNQGASSRYRWMDIRCQAARFVQWMTGGNMKFWC